MTDLRRLVLYTFMAGMFFDSFISATVRNHLGMASIFMILAIGEAWIALNLYDKLKVKK